MVHACVTKLQSYLLYIFTSLTTGLCGTCVTIVHCMLCGSMFSAQLVYSAGVDQAENEVKMMKAVVFLLSSPAHRLSVQPLLW